MADNEHLRERFISQLGESAWDQNWASVLKWSPELLEASIDLLAVPKQKRHLSPKTQQLISIAVDSSSTHLYLPGVRQHVKEALKQGATPAEIMELIELTSTLGIHACNIGVPVLLDVMREAAIFDQHPTAGQPFDSRREQLKADFVEKRGYWHHFWEEFLALDPKFFAAYTQFSSVSWVKGMEDGKRVGGLEPKVKELIYCAFDAAATHLYVPGLRAHMHNVLKYGGTPEEILEVLEIATQLSLHTAHAATPILEQCLASQEEDGG